MKFPLNNDNKNCIAMLTDKSSNLILFLEQIRILLEAGVAVDRTFRTIGRDSKNSHARVATVIANQLEKGDSLAVIMENETNLFDTFDIAIIKSCWETGDLSEGFSQLYHHHSKKSELHNQLRTAFTYPAILTASSFGAIIVLLTVVVPKFQSMALGDDVNISGAMEFIFFLSNLLLNHGIKIGVTVLGLIGASLSPYGKRLKQKILMTTPWLANVIKRIETERWARGLALLLSRGIPIQQALDIGANLYSVNQMRETGKTIAIQIRQGKKLAVTMAECGDFPDAAIQLVRTGEETGELGLMLEKTADFLSLESRTKLNSALSIIEPAAILMLGAIVALIVLSLISLTINFNETFL